MFTKTEPAPLGGPALAIPPGFRLSRGPVTLAPHRPENLSLLFAWENDAELLAMSSDSLAATSLEETRQRLESWIGGGADAIQLGIYLSADERLVGFLQIACIDQENSRCKIGLVVGDKAQWGRGYGRRALDLAVEYAFVVLKLHRIGAEAYADNPRSLRLLERVGFRREGVLRGSVLRHDRFVDEIVFGLLREEWRSAPNGSCPSPVPLASPDLPGL